MLKVKQLIRMIERNGWVCVSTRGSHMKFVHPVKAGMLIIPFHSDKTLAKGFVNKILKKAGML
ncbi:MAG: hypothetical protein A2X22_07350 [Bacteroidetes bacterium GWF2_49_14]|nr:MAG: hypothetical protein A2X22_07350 [Bacteroidetes bacterium GWF2_49_14]HBB91945.1 addiction module toxin, HicA family [Bacteroidales bacterium]